MGRNRKSKRRTRKNITYNMKGCNGKKTCFKGGNGFYKPAPPVPAPLVGSPIKNDIPAPGQNYYKLDSFNNDPTRMMKIRGGRRTKKVRRHKKRIGGGVFSGLSNLVAEGKYDISSIKDEVSGYPPGPNPLPWKDQIPKASGQLIV